MPRRSRSIEGGLVYHVLNRAIARTTLFRKDDDYAAFERVLAAAHEREPLRILAYSLMPNHWHFVVWPQPGAHTQVSEFLRWLTLTHTQRWHAHHHSAGTGHLYQGRFKSFPVQCDDHLFTLLRYVERNPLRAGLVKRAENWRWGSLWRRTHGDAKSRELLADWPITRPRNWVARVQEAETTAELDAVRCCVRRGTAFGSEEWTRETAVRLGLEHTLRPRGRPRKASA